MFFFLLRVSAYVSYLNHLSLSHYNLTFGKSVASGLRSGGHSILCRKIQKLRKALRQLRF